MRAYITDPDQIERESMQIIHRHLKRAWKEYELPVVERLIHTSGDISLEDSIRIHPEAIQAGLEALRRGANVITDVEMVYSGISKKMLQGLGGKAICFLNDSEVAEKAKSWELTRTMTALRLHAQELKGAIVAIGNAPTALLEVLRLAEDPASRPALIVGMPVGFVGAAESKEELWAEKGIPCITIAGTRGGSPLAATSVNALLRMAVKNNVRAKTLMFQGTSSNVGKSVLTAAFCRIFYQEGLRTVPFKAQNMALNSFVTVSGGEMGRAQVVQAQAAGCQPDVRMNPVLLKPTGQASSQVILLGKAQGTLSALRYHGEYQQLTWPVIKQSLDELLAENEVVVIEGAGSPAEVNLKANDIVNMRVAKAIQAPVILIADIDRGGALASVVGTLELLDADERAFIKGIILNKFRGEVQLLQPALDFLAEKTGIPVVGVVPYFTEFMIPEEDSVALEGWVQASDPRRDALETLDIAVIRLPYISNFTDFDALRDEADVQIRYVDSSKALGTPDLVILPGSKNTLADLLFLRETGLAEKLLALWKNDAPLIGICGGYQMLGKVVRDPLHTESDLESLPGLGILAIETDLNPEKHTSQTAGRILTGASFFANCQGEKITGYEIHTGRSYAEADQEFLFELGSEGQEYADGYHSGSAWGTYLHGIFDNDVLRQALLEALWERRGKQRPVENQVSQTALREQALNQLADWVRRHVDVQAIRQFMGLNP